jgi:hypothetical protein
VSSTLRHVVGWPRAIPCRLLARPCRSFRSRAPRRSPRVPADRELQVVPRRFAKSYDTITIVPAGERVRIRPFFGASLKVFASRMTRGQVELLRELELPTASGAFAGAMRRSRRFRSPPTLRRARCRPRWSCRGPPRRPGGTPFEKGDCSANSAASIWCGLRSTAASKRDIESRSSPPAARSRQLVREVLGLVVRQAKKRPRPAGPEKIEPGHGYHTPLAPGGGPSFGR